MAFENPVPERVLLKVRCTIPQHLPPRAASLAGLTWGAEDQSAAVGAICRRDGGGTLSPLYALANSLCVCAATAAGVPAIGTLFADFRDLSRLAASCRVARRRGYSGKVAIHPGQVAVINAAFSLSEAELAAAQRIVDAFTAQPDAGTLSLDGVMLDTPHLKQAPGCQSPPNSDCSTKCRQ